jgi:hypothetical protein
VSGRLSISAIGESAGIQRSGANEDVTLSAGTRAVVESWPRAESATAGSSTPTVKAMTVHRVDFTAHGPDRDQQAYRKYPPSRRSVSVGSTGRTIPAEKELAVSYGVS